MSIVIFGGDRLGNIQFVKRSCSQLREALLSLKTAAVEGKSRILGG
jgi:hypothetical protein